MERRLPIGRASPTGAMEVAKRHSAGGGLAQPRVETSGNRSRAGRWLGSAGLGQARATDRNRRRTFRTGESGPEEWPSQARWTGDGAASGRPPTLLCCVTCVPIERSHEQLKAQP